MISENFMVTVQLLSRVNQAWFARKDKYKHKDKKGKKGMKSSLRHEERRNHKHKIMVIA